VQETLVDSARPEAVSGIAGPGRLAIVEYLRGIAALSVAWFHLTNSYSDGWVKASGQLGWLGVDVFFVISGFVIPLSISKTSNNYSLRDFPAFMVRRLVRLEPPYLISIVLALVLWHLSVMAPGFKGQDTNYTFAQLAAHLLYLIPMTDFDWLQPVYWSLAWEFAFYIAMGLTFAVINPARNPTAWYGIAALALLLVVGKFVPARALLFVVGICLFRITTVAREASPVGDLVLAVLSVSVMAISNSKIAAVGACTALTIYIFRSRRAPGVPGTAMAGLGAISYSLYLTHVPIGGRVVNSGRRFGDGQLFELTLSSIALATCVIFAVLFWRFVERPFVAIGKSATKKYFGH